MPSTAAHSRAASPMYNVRPPKRPQNVKRRRRHALAAPSMNTLARPAAHTSYATAHVTPTTTHPNVNVCRGPERCAAMLQLV